MTIRRTTPSKNATAIAIALFVQRQIAAADARHDAGSVVATTTPDGVVVSVTGPAPVVATATATDSIAERIRATRLRMAQERQALSQR